MFSKHFEMADGINIDSSDHISHMAYSDGESGPCPASHPNRIVTLFYG